MSGRPPRGRGRARGRARDAEVTPGPSTAWGLPQRSGPMMSWGRGTQRGVTESPGHQEPVESTSGPEGVGNANSLRRGTIRGKRPVQVVVRTRPAALPTKLGTHGTSVSLCANYFKLLQQPNWCLYQYRVDIAPEEDRTSVKKALFHQAIRGLLAGYIFDGTVLYTANRLNPDPLEVFVQDEQSDKNFRFTVRLVGDVAAGDYQYIQLFNILMRKCLGHLKLQLVGRDFFDAVAKVTVPEHRMELWPGYITSLRQHESDILMCVEVTHKVMRQDTVLHLLSECAKEDVTNYKRNFASRIIGTVVLTEYNNRTYRIDDVDFKSTPSSSFSKKDGTSITYAQYFQDRYNLRIRSMDQPMLISRAKAREIRAGMAEQVYLVPELCRMTGLTDAQRANFQLMRSLSDHTRMAPGPRIQKLIQFSQRLNSEPKAVEELKRWDFQLSKTLVELAGRALPPENIECGNKKIFSAGAAADWTRELHDKPMLATIELNQWVVVCPGRLRSSAASFMQMLINAAEGMQWRIPFPKLKEIPDDRTGTYIEGIETALNNFNPQLVVCIVPNNKSDRYAAIKKKCYIDRAVPNQVILAKNLNAKGVMSIATKIAIQINVKIGGAPWSIPLPYNNTMVVGYDVCHDTNHKERSYGALVATLNKHCTHYFSTVTAHTNGEELSNDLALGLIRACKTWKQQNGELPEKILFYRDGVGDGQLAYVSQHEVENVKQKLAQFYGSADKVKMCFIVVSKRINTRIFTQREQNPVPGTVVDDVITLPERYDFFIVSQCVRQGTVSPTSYNVIFDNMDQPADKIQRVTYKLTHMYFNWSGTVRVPAPCQYSHKLAFLVGQYLHRNPHPELEKSLYFL